MYKRRHISKVSEILQIDPFAGSNGKEFRDIITVMSNKGQIKYVSINWSAVGAVSLEDAIKFRDALTEAIEAAEKMEAELKGRP